MAANTARKLPDHLIAGIMAMGVVDRLEAVEIGHHDRKRTAAGARTFKQALQVAVEVTAVVHAGQRVRHGHFDGLGDRSTQAVIVALAAHLRSQPGLEFLRLDRPRHIVVDAQLEPPCHHFLLVGLGHKDDGCEARKVHRTQVRAQAQRVKLREAGGDDDRIIGRVDSLEETLLGIGNTIDLARFGQNFLQTCRRRVTLIDQQEGNGTSVFLGGATVQQLFDADVTRGRSAQAQFVGQALEAHEAQLQVIDRLCQKIIGANFQTTHAVGRLVERSHHDNGNMRGLRVGLQAAADLKTVDARHHDVEQDHVDTLRFADCQRIHSVGGRQHLEILRQQARLEEAHIGRNVINDENACGHWFPCSRRQASPR